MQGTLDRNEILAQIELYNLSIDKQVSDRNRAYSIIRQLMIQNRNELCEAYIIKPDNSIKITDPRWSAISQDEKRLRLYGLTAWQVLYYALNHISAHSVNLRESRISVCK